MNGMWQRFTRAFEDAETAGVALLVGILAVAVSIGLLVHWIASARYTAAIGLLTCLGGITAICMRDYRRGRWSIVSGLVVGVWLLFIAAAIACAAWLSWLGPYSASSSQPLFP